MRRCIMVAGLLGLAAAAAGQPATGPSPEAKLIEDLYGKRIARALAAPDAKDNVALARELLLAAADSANPKLLRRLLAMEAVKVATPVGSDEAAKLARDALALAEKLQKLDPADRWRLELEIADRRYEAARKAGAPVQDCGPLAADVIETQIGLAKALMAEEKLEPARAGLMAARVMARAHGLTGADVDVEAALETLKACTLRLERIRKAEAQLERAKLANDAEQINAARQTLGAIYLLADGDLAKANSFLDRTGHEYEKCVKAALEFTLNPRRLPPAESCNEIVEALGQAAKAAHSGEARVKIATVGMNICRGFLAGNAAGLAGTKARLLLIQMEQLAEDSPAHRLARKLKANYGSLEGKLEVLQKGVVRVSYDFSSHKQLNDLSVKEGRWQVARVQNRDALVGEAQQRQRSRVESRLRFYANKPLSLSCVASGPESLVGVLIFLRRNDPRYGTHEVECELGAYGNRESVLRDDGWRAWVNNRAKLVPNTTYQIQIDWDGDRNVTWSVNGQVLCKQDIRFQPSDVASSALTVGLQTSAVGAGFDDLKIEGAVMEDPSERLDRSGKP